MRTALKVNAYFATQLHNKQQITKKYLFNKQVQYYLVVMPNKMGHSNAGHPSHTFGYSFPCKQIVPMLE